MGFTSVRNAGFDTPDLGLILASRSATFLQENRATRYNLGVLFSCYSYVLLTSVSAFFAPIRSVNSGHCGHSPGVRFKSARQATLENRLLQSRLYLEGGVDGQCEVIHAQDEGTQGN
jgi:hypothetical protein